jgi:hypothetical protein
LRDYNNNFLKIILLRNSEYNVKIIFVETINFLIFYTFRLINFNFFNIYIFYFLLPVITGPAKLKFNKFLIKIILKIKVRAHSNNYYKKNYY